MFLHVLVGSLLFGFTQGRIHSMDPSRINNVVSVGGDGSPNENQLEVKPSVEASDEEFQDRYSMRQTRDEDCNEPPPLIKPENDLAALSLWEILGKTEKEMEIHNGDAVLLLGNTGSGKSTAVLTITSDLKNLTVYEIKGGALIIVDDNQKIGITTSSRTLVPELLHDPPNNLHFYDCPGFLDNRDYKADITANYLMKKATEGLTSVRTVFVVPEDSVSVAGTKTDFGTLATSAVRMIKDLNKLQPGIGMIVSKVKNYDQRPRFRNDTVILNGVTKFLEEYREGEQKKLTQLRSNMNDESNMFVRRQKVYSPWKFPHPIREKRATDEQEVIRRRIQFVDILLQKDKISIFRSPNECGSFDQSTWSQESKDWMTKLIRDYLKSVPIEESDFGYAVSSDTSLKVVDLFKELNFNVTDLVFNLVKDLRITQLELTLAIKDFFQTKAWLDADYTNFTQTIQDLKTSKSPKEFGKSIYKVLVARGYEQKWALNFIAEAEKIESYMDFFDSIAPEGVSYDRKNTEWLEPLKSWVTEEVSARKEWYGFLDKLRKVYSYFRFQSVKQSSVPNNITEIKASLGNDEDIVTDQIIQLYDEFVSGSRRAILAPDDMEILWEIVNEAFEVPEIQCRGSKMIVKGSFVKASDFTQSDGSFILCKGTNSPPSQVVVYATRKVFFDRSVNAQKSADSNKEFGIVSPVWEVTQQVSLDLSGQHGSSGGSRSSRQIRSLTSEEDPLQTDDPEFKSSIANEIYMEFDDILAFSLANHSSRWVISDSEIPVLRSAALRVSKYDLPSYIRSKCDLKDIPSNGGSGSIGSAGKHGGPGGNLIGLVGHIENAERLKVTVQGGAGGAGQDGADGTEGQKGPEYGYSEWRTCDNSAPCSSECSGRGECRRDSKSVWTKYFDTCHRKESGVVDCIAYGCVGGKGGRGGDGGAGGKGGVGGQGIVVAADGSKVSIVSEGGSKGKDGNGGTGGLGGKRGNGALAGIHKSTTFDCPCWWEDMKYDWSSWERSDSGANGVTGANKNGQGNLKDPSLQLSQPDLLLEFTEFALSKDSLYFPNQEFLDLIGHSPQVANNFTHIHFAQELLILERANLLLKNKKVTRDSMTLMMTPKYESFLSRVDGHVKSRRLDDPQRKFLSLLYSTAFNQVRTLQQALGAPLVVDVSGYLETVDKRLQEYSKTETKVVVEAERVRYKDTFTQKIKDAMEFICDTVDPAIDQTFFEMAKVTDQLVVAIERMIAEAEKAEAVYKEAVKQAKKKMQLNILFGSLKVGAAVIGLVGGPAGAAVGGIIGGATSIGESLALGGSGEIRPPTPLDPKIKKYADQMEAKAKATSHERQDELNTLIGESRIAATENKEFLEMVTSTSSSLKEFQNLKNNVIARKTSSVDQNKETNQFIEMTNHINTLEKDKKNLIEKGPSSSLKEFQDLNKKVIASEKSLIDQNKKTNEFIKKAQKGDAGTAEEQKAAKTFGDKAISGLNKINDAVEIVSTLGLDIYNKYKDDKNEIKRLMGMVEEAKEQIKDLKSYEKAVDGLLVPFTESVINDLDEAQKQMEGQNAVFLRVQQWQVQKVLRQYNFFLQDFTGAFPEISGQYAYLVEDLQEAMTLMIDLYSCIDQYNEQMQFADYIANINSPRGLAAKFGPEESAIYEKINLALQGSIILSEWDTCIQTFQQWVFPFSDEFQQNLLTSEIPDYLSPTTPAEIFTDVLPNIRQRVSNLVIALRQYKSATFPVVDNRLYFTTFNSELTSTFPFHVWRQKLNQDKIRDLLSGKQVTFSVTPEFTYQRDMSAVKFTIAEIEPKARNSTIQKELNEVLKKVKIEMSHSGVSKYLHEGTPFQMVGAKQEIHFNYERDDENQRLSPNQVYTKIKSGDVILSPYTLWTVQLFKAYSSIQFDFAELEKFADFVDLELIGKGSFVRKKNTKAKRPAAVHPLPLHYFHFKLSNLPALEDNSRLQNLLLFS